MDDEKKGISISDYRSCKHVVYQVHRLNKVKGLASLYQPADCLLKGVNDQIRRNEETNNPLEP